MKNPLWYIYGDYTYVWFRLFRTWYGFSWKDASKHSLIFSERSGKTGVWIGNYIFHILKPIK
jgi:hypothetical protein